MPAHARFAFAVALLSLSGALTACDATPAASDGGTDASMPDGGQDGGPPFACAETTRLDGVLGETVTLMFDTTMTETRPRDLGLTCGNPEGQLRWAPQEVVELHVPGTGPVAVGFSTLTEGTDLEFNTLIQVRTSCGEIPAGVFPPTCFDDPADPPMEYHASGEIAASGGDVLFFYVTGYSRPPAEQGTTDSGRVQVDFTVRANAPPTVTSAFMRLADNDVAVGAVGMDPDANVRGIAMNFLGPDGALLDIYGDGTATMDGSVYWVFFDPAPTGTSYDEVFVVRNSLITLGAYLRGIRASGAILRVFDSAWATSEPVEVTIEMANLVGYEQACDGMNICRDPMTCTAGTCGLTGLPASVCGAATPIVIATPTDVATSTTVTGTVGSGMIGAFFASCAAGEGSLGSETVYTIDVPAGAYDLLVTTDLPTTGRTDTVLYMRTACGDSGSDVGCSDDISRTNNHSAIDLLNAPAGTYYVLAELFGGATRSPLGLRATLRPVRATGESCDPVGVTSRCAVGACPAATLLCP